MFGFLFGTLCLIGLILVLKHEHRKRHGDWGGGYHGWGGCGHGWHGWHGRHGGIGRNPFLRQLFLRLDTTPGQERAIRAALDDFFNVIRDSKRSLWQSRPQLASVFRSEAFDETALADVIARHDEAVEQLRTKAVDTIAAVYQVLDPRQRERVAQWLESGPKTPPGGPYRTQTEPQ